MVNIFSVERSSQESRGFSHERFNVFTLENWTGGFCHSIVNEQEVFSATYAFLWYKNNMAIEGKSYREPSTDEIENMTSEEKERIRKLTEGFSYVFFDKCLLNILNFTQYDWYLLWLHAMLRLNNRVRCDILDEYVEKKLAEGITEKWKQFENKTEHTD